MSSPPTPPALYPLLPVLLAGRVDGISTVIVEVVRALRCGAGPADEGAPSSRGISLKCLTRSGFTRLDAVFGISGNAASPGLSSDHHRQAGRPQDGPRPGKMGQRRRAKR